MLAESAAVRLATANELIDFTTDASPTRHRLARFQSRRACSLSARHSYVRMYCDSAGGL
jgi:hypothetical protein